MTVKELLQQRRAQQEKKNMSSGLQESRVQLCDTFPSCAGIYGGNEPLPSAPISQRTRQLQNCAPYVESFNVIDQQLLDTYLPAADPLIETSPDCMVNPSFGSLEDTSPFFNHSMTPESPSGVSDLSNSFEYSPSQQGMPFVPQIYSSPSPQDLISCAELDHYYHEANSTLFCYCAYCCSLQHQEPMKIPDLMSFSSTDYIEYLPSATITEDFFGSEVNSLCYI
ncbi:POU class 2 homeobox associating factor 3 [Bombina bombina]|uniref:POU class 2 homeobox associating factor 3 n=1 Tax=Bombina bombina TaxID=8345 RepID=UPI00235AF684|nr:POU class 2 homeobox associating factor 3 [Bombina bombina]